MSLGGGGGGIVHTFIRTVMLAPLKIVSFEWLSAALPHMRLGGHHGLLKSFADSRE